jgi:hypothetical protein
MIKVIVEIKNVYGKELVYPICENAKLFAKIAGSKTLSGDTIKHMKSLGVQFELAQKEITI